MKMADRIMHGYPLDKDKVAMAEFFAVDMDWPTSGRGKDTCTHYFADGSALMVRMDENLKPVEWLTV